MPTRIRSLVVFFMCSACLAATPGDVHLPEPRPLRVATADWNGDPLVFRFFGDSVRSALPKGTGIAIYEGAPTAAEVTVEADFAPLEAGGTEWSLGAVAIVRDERNYWHLALVQAPPEKGSRRMIELVEMRDGRWHAQQNLRGTTLQAARESWQPGRRHRLRLQLGRDGIEGSVTSEDGRTLLRQRYDFNGPAVCSGRPALRVAGCTGTFSSLRAGWIEAPAVGASRPSIPAYAPDVAGTSGEVRHRASGFFRVERNADGRWWAVDPLGREVVLLGVDHVTYQGHWCEKLGFNPHERKNAVRHPERGTWEVETLGRLRAWGFNLLGAGSDPLLRHRGLVHTDFLNIGSHLAALGDDFDITPDERRPCSAFPNVFHPDFEAYCRYRARQAASANRDDPWLFGIFIDNELAWWGRGEAETGLFDAALRKRPGHAAREALQRLVEERCGGDIAAANTLFGTRCATFEELFAAGKLSHATEAQRAVKRAFLALAAERYFATTCRSIREADPNHLVLGARFAGTEGAAPLVWEIAGKHCDVVTFNSYPMADLDRGAVYTHLGRGGEHVGAHYARFHALARRPMLITEWSFPALDAGLPSLHGAGQRFRTQEERTRATQLYARTLLSQPYLLGYDYFMWVDEPALGVSSAFPEDSNYGLINEDGVPYEHLTRMFAALHREAPALRLAPAPTPAAVPGAGSLPSATEVARRAAAAAAATVVPVSEPAFVREGSRYRLSNGLVELSGEIGRGPLVRNVVLSGAGAAPRTVGRYNAMLHTRDPEGGQRWSDTREVVSVEGRSEGGVAVAELEGTGAAGGTTYAVRHRLLLPRGAAWWAAECIQVKNTGDAPLRLRALYFRADAAFSDLPAALPPNLWGFPEAGAWLHAADGLFYGTVASRRSAVRIHFWLDGPGGSSMHPDARIELTETLVAPGAIYRPEGPAHLLCVVGCGGEAAWLAAAQALRRALE